MIEFAKLTSPQLGELLKRRPLALLPVGQVEEHGPHLPLDTDAVIAERVTHAAAADLEALPAMVLPTLWAGYSGRELTHWPGTIRVRTRVFADLVSDVVQSLVAMGVSKIITVNGHGHHPALLEMVAREVADDTGVYIACVDVARMAAPAVARHRRSEPGGCIHACEFETALALYLGLPVDMSQAPTEDHFRYRSDNVSGDGFTPGKRVFWSTWGIQRSQSGAYGDPVLATAAMGEAVFQEAVSNLTAFCREYHAAPPADWGPADSR